MTQLPYVKGTSWVLAGLLALSGLPAQALDLTYSFNIPAQDARSAIFALAATAQISIGGLDPRQCLRQSAALKARLTAGAALDSLLSHSHCRAQRLDAATFVLVQLGRSPAKAKAQPPSPLLQEVIVTANRRSQLAGDAPSAVSVISSVKLGHADPSLAAVASNVPGMTLTNLGSGRDKILLRGISDGIFTGRTQSTVGLYLDDTPITFNAPDPDLLLTDIARVEVLRGPQGALYGEGSISGVVRLVSQKPDLGESSTRILASYALGGGDPSSRVESMVNLPVIHDRLGIRTVLYDEQMGGYINDLSLGKRNSNTTHRYGGRVSSLWQINEDWALTGTYALQEINAKNSQYVSGNLGPYVRAVTLAEPHDNDFSNASLSVEGHLLTGTLRASFNHLHHHIQSRYDASNQAFALAELSGAPNSGLIAFDEGQQVELETEDISLTSRPDQRLRWLIGTFTAQSSERFLPLVSDMVTEAQLYTEARFDRIHTQALYGEASFDLSPALTFTAGLRSTLATHDMNSLRRTQILLGPVSDAFQARSHSRHLSHQFVIKYRPSPSLIVYAQSAEGYRDEGFNTTHLATSPAIPVTYNGDELNSYETGLKLNLPARRLRLSAAVFRVLWRDIQSDQLQATGLPLTVTIGNGENTGLELEGDWEPWESLTLHGAALINEPRLTKPNPLYATAEDSGLPFIARHSASLSANWRRSFQDAWLETEATLSYRGISHLNFGPLQTVEMGGFAQLALGLYLHRSGMSYSLRIDNVTAATGNSFAYGNPFSLNVQPQSTPLRPRTVWLSVGLGY